MSKPLITTSQQNNLPHIATYKPHPSSHQRHSYYDTPLQQYGGGNNYSSSSSGAPRLTRWKGPTKVLCFCLLAVILPSFLVSLALLMRFVVTGTASYHLSPSDMRLIDHKLSTTWCQGASLTGNGSFTAYVTDEEPTLVSSPDPLTMHRTFIVPDDHKEYWGFYLLKGSTFRIHTCSRHKGGTLLVVLGRSHLEHCAYIGEADSAGDSDQFSSSSSREQQQQQPHNPHLTTTSKEEMGLILSKIRQYIRSGPNNYGKLKHNLLQWNLINDTTTTNESDVVAVPTDHGLIYPPGGNTRSRRSPTLTHLSESGENNANEDINNDDIQKPNATTTGDNKQTPAGVWTVEHAHHAGTLTSNVTSTNLDEADGSDSESESSWSSSEEAMARCEGVLTHLVIPHNDTCDDSNPATPPEFFFEGLVNQTGYYYFIFASENEKRDNIITAHFQLHKHVYHLPDPLPNCTNVLQCSLNLSFASSQKLVVTLPRPLPERESAWDDVYVLESECTPRTSIYLLFVLTVPLLILMCAFQ